MVEKLQQGAAVAILLAISGFLASLASGSAGRPYLFIVSLFLTAFAIVIVLGSAFTDRLKRNCIVLAAVIAIGITIILVTQPQSTTSGSSESLGPSTTTTSQTTTTTTAPHNRTTTTEPIPTTTTTSPPQVSFLISMDPYSGSWYPDLETSSASIAGIIYPNSLDEQNCFGNPGDVQVVEYDISSGFQTFTATVGMADGTDPTWQSDIEVLVDGQAKLSQSLQVGHSYPVLLDVSGATSLTFRFETLGGAAGCGSIVPSGPTVGDPKLTS